MKAGILEVLSGMGILIAIYLFLSNGTKTVSIINALSNATTNNVKALQGR